MTANSGMDAEYVAMRRRMSRLRVNCNKKASLEAEDTPKGGDDPGFKDLIRYWKKHGIPIPKELKSDMDNEHVKREVAKSKGRRRSRELEDLHFCASTGKFNLERLSTVPDEDTPSKGTPPAQKRPAGGPGLESKSRGGSLKGKSPSRSNMFASTTGAASPRSSPHPTKKLSRTQSNFK